MNKIREMLRPYQVSAVNILNENRRMLEYDEMGLGKTLTVLASLEEMFEYNKTPAHLIFCPKFALYVWQDEIMHWFGKKSMIYSGTIPKRKKLWDEYVMNDYHYIITTYGMLQEIMDLTKEYKIQWDSITADEIHGSGLLNYKSDTFKLFEKFARTIPCVRLLTGTPIRQGVIDAFAPLNIINRTVFSNYWSFVNRYCITIQTPFGKSIERRPKDTEEFRKMMSQYMIRRTKDEVLSELPGKQRQSIFCEMTDKQMALYTSMLEEMIAMDDDNLVMAPNSMSVILRLRQLLVTPRLLGFNEDGAAIGVLTDMVSDLIDGEEPVVIFTPFRQALPFIEESLRKAIKDLKIYHISGGMTALNFAKQWKGFQESRIKRKVLLCVIKSGASFHATEASNCFFLGYEWDFNQNVQSEDRLFRLGQKKFVNVYYIMHKNTVDEDVAQKLNDKQDASNWIIGDEQQYEALLHRFKIKLDKYNKDR